MEQFLHSLLIMLFGMCGIFMVAGVISIGIALLNKIFKKEELTQSRRRKAAALRRRRQYEESNGKIAERVC